MKKMSALASALKFSQNRRAGDRCEKGRAFWARPFVDATAKFLLEVFVDESCHLEHGNLLASAEHGTEVVVGVDHATILRILQSLTANVGPQFLRYLCTRERRASDYWSELRTWRHRLHERCARHALRSGLFLC